MDNNEAKYVRFEKELLKIKKVCNKSGESLVFTGNIKILYQYMHDRYLFFKRLNKEFFDDQRDIAEAIGVTEKTSSSLIGALCEFGLIEKTKKKIRGAWTSNSYVVHDIFDKEKFDCGAKIERSVLHMNKPTQQQKPIVQKKHEPAAHTWSSSYDEGNVECPF